MQNNTDKWWELPLAELSAQQWESLCDHCGMCCLDKVVDEEEQKIWFLRTACTLYDAQKCQCGDYLHRQLQVPECAQIRLEDLPTLAQWLPYTCAYRLRYLNLPLQDWHPLISGSRETVHTAGISAQSRLKDLDPDWDDVLVQPISE